MASLPTPPPRYGAGTLGDLLPSVLAALGMPRPADPLGRIGDRLALTAPGGPLSDSGTAPPVRRVAVLLLDGLGAHLVGEAARHAPTLAALAAGRLGGPAQTLTCGFPATTPVSLVSLGTGVAPGRHGVVGFSVRVPPADGDAAERDAAERVLNHIRWRDDPPPRSWQPVPSLLEVAAAAGVRTVTVNRPEFVGSGLTTAIVGAGAYRGAAGPDALVDGVIAELSTPDEPVLVYAYHHQPDNAGHEYGVGSPEWTREIVAVDRMLSRLVDRLPRGAALLVTADHGMVNIPVHDRLDLGEPRYAYLRDGVRTLAGEPRVRYLHTRPDATPDVLDTWRSVLGAGAWVAPRDEAVAAGLFGPVPAAHRPRIGDVVVVAVDDRTAVFATGVEPPALARLVGLHGSVTPAERDIPLFVARR